MIIQRIFEDLTLEEVGKLASGEWIEVDRLDNLLIIEVPESSATLSP